MSGLQSSRIARAPQRNPAFKKNVSTVVVLTTLYCKYLWNCLVKDYTVVSGSKTWPCHFLLYDPEATHAETLSLFPYLKSEQGDRPYLGVGSIKWDGSHLNWGVPHKQKSLKSYYYCHNCDGSFISCIRLGTLSPSPWYNYLSGNPGMVHAYSTPQSFPILLTS